MDSSEGWGGGGLGLNQAVLKLHRKGMVIPQSNTMQSISLEYLTIRPVARKGYGSIAHEAKPNGLLTRGP